MFWYLNIFLVQTFQRYSIESDTPHQVSSMTRLSVPSITPPGLAKSYGIKSVLNISLASLFPSMSASREQEQGQSTARSTLSTSFTEAGESLVSANKLFPRGKQSEEEAF